MFWGVIMWLPSVVLERALRPMTTVLENLADTTNAEIEPLGSPPCPIPTSCRGRLPARSEFGSRPSGR